MSSGIYNVFREDLLDKKVDFETHIFKIALMGNNHELRLTNSLWDEVSKNEINSEGYIAGGEVLRNIKVVIKENDMGVIDADNIAWWKINSSVRYMIWYNFTTSRLCGCFDLGHTYSVDNTMFKIIWHELGLLYDHPLSLPPQYLDYYIKGDL